jgi:aminoglycoside phosphotransferase (APT) family kinase protein
MIDPRQTPTKIDDYLSTSLGAPTKLISAVRLPKSTRDAPYLLETLVVGMARSFVLRQGPPDLEYEFQVMRAVAGLPFPSPAVYGWDPAGETLGVPCFICDYIEGESLLQPLLDGEDWAANLYLESVAALQSITAQDLAPILPSPRRESAVDVLEEAWSVFQENPHPLAERAYRVLKHSTPRLPELRFSNGDLWLDNFIVKDRQLAGVIDFEHAGFSDPIFEFLLSFFVEPQLRGRGLEERYCRRMGFDPGLMSWYHGLEFFDTLRYLLPKGETFVHHTVASLEADLARWLDEFEK